MTAVAVAPHSSNELPASSLVRDDVRLPIAAPESINHFIQAERVRRGDTLSSLLNRLGALDADFQRFVTTNAVARKVLQMRTGRTVLAELDADGLVYRFSYRINGLEPDESRPAQSGRRVLIERQGDRFVAREEESPLERQTASRFVEVRTTLNAAADAGDIPDAITAQLGDVFSSSVDVNKDLRAGDTVRVVYETLREAGSFDAPVAGRLLAAELVAGGVHHQALWFEPTRKTGRLNARVAGRGDYFDFNGSSLKKSFLRNPLEASKVMSGFTEARLHPILRDWRAHKGVDFAAPTGTRVRSTADGAIEFVGQQRGYGNVVIIKHSAQITTLYAHLSGFTDDMKVGARVNQGDVIGFVGQTGWATGPHLHYEFRINDEQADPLTVALPDAQPPLDPQDRQRFATNSAALIGEIRRFGELQIARFQ